MQSIHDIIGMDAVSAAQATFGMATVNAVGAMLLEKNGRTYIKCQVRGKDIQAKHEEIIRQLWLHRLLHHYSYPKSRIGVEYPVTFGRDTSKRADIVVFDKDDSTAPYILVEVKQGKRKEGKDQLKSYTLATGAPLALWGNAAEGISWYRQNYNTFVEIPDLPNNSQSIQDIVNQPWTIETLIEKENERDKAGAQARSLRDLIEDMENEVLANAGVDVFEEVFKLIFTKLYDEMNSTRSKNKTLRFRNTGTASEVKEQIQTLFDEARAKWPGVFPESDRLRLSAEHLQVCVGSLEEWKLFNSNLDVVDEAFEYLVNKSSKGEKGQYFTPRWVIDMAVKMMSPKEDENIIDTAAGSAGFTVHSIFYVWEQILKDENIPTSHLFTVEDKPARCHEYVKEKVYAIDFDEKSVRVARCLNLIAGDGQTNVLHLNTLDYTRWDQRVKEDEEWDNAYGDGWRRFKRLRAEKASNRQFKFDLLLANPPFAGDIKQSSMLSHYDLGHKPNGKIESAVGRDLLFIERNLDFLKPGGRMAVVLPQGRFNNSSDKRVREYIMERCRILAVVGLHPNTFKPHTGTKTSVLFVQKWNDDPEAGALCPRVDDYPIFFATQQKASKDNSGDKIYVTDERGLRLRDSHGHWIVQHDLFNHDNLTGDGIAEAFIEFARREQLSFF